MSDCLFCAIAEGSIPSEKVYEDDRIVAFRDIKPQAPVHVLVAPKKHIASLDETRPEDAELLGYIMLKLKDIASQQGLVKGYRVVVNTGADAMQTVKHLHVHMLGGKPMADGMA